MKHETRHSLNKPSRGKVAAKSLAAAAAISVPFLGFAAPANAAPDSTWDQLAECESGGDWGIDTGNGFSGGLQFQQSTWDSHGGSGDPANASRSEQIRVAENVLDNQGWGAWPSCSQQIGASGQAEPSDQSVDQQQEQASQEQQTQQQEPVQEEQQAPVEEQQEPVQEEQQAPVEEQQAPVEEQQAPVEEQQQAPVQEQQVEQPAEPAPQPAASGETYTVQSGDTLSAIANKQGVDGGWEAIYELNADQVSDPVLIYPGQELAMP